MDKKEFLERLKNCEENMGKPLEFSLTEERIKLSKEIIKI